METKRTIEYRGLICEGTMVYGDWEGDPSVVKGVHYLPPSCDDVFIHVPGDDDDLSDILSQAAMDEIVDRMLEV